MHTVRQLARRAGVTPRTPHFFDQISLLEPTRSGEDSYRYYGEETPAEASAEQKQRIG